MNAGLEKELTLEQFCTSLPQNVLKAPHSLEKTVTQL